MAAAVPRGSAAGDDRHGVPLKQLEVMALAETVAEAATPAAEVNANAADVAVPFVSDSDSGSGEKITPTTVVLDKPGDDSMAADIIMQQLQYAVKHNVHVVVDDLLSYVCTRKPRNPAAAMGRLLQKQMTNSSGASARGAIMRSDVSFSSPHTPGCGESGYQDFAFTSTQLYEDANSQAQLKIAQYGIWFHINSRVAHAICVRLTRRLEKDYQDVLENYNTFEDLIQSLSFAALTEHFKGFSEAFKLINLTPDNQLPIVIQNLKEVVLDVVMMATPSDRQLFTAFMDRMALALSPATKGEHYLLMDLWIRATDTQDKYDHLCSQLEHELFLVDPYLGSIAGFPLSYLNLLKVVLPVLTREPAVLHEVKMFMQVWASKNFLVTPYHFAYLNALTLSVITDVVELDLRKPLTDVQLLAWSTGLECIVSFANGTYRKTPENAVAALFKAPPNLMLTIYRIYRAKDDTFHDRSIQNATLAVALQRSTAYSETRAQEFLEATKRYMSETETFPPTENYQMHAMSVAFKELFKLLYMLVERRHTVSLLEALRMIYYRHCFGVNASKMFLFYQEKLFGTLVPMEERVDAARAEGVKAVLAALQELCVGATAKQQMVDVIPAVRDVFDSISETAYYERIADLLVITPELPFRKMLTRLQYLGELADILRYTFLPCDGTDQYLVMCLAHGLHLMASCISISERNNFVTNCMLVVCTSLIGIVHPSVLRMMVMLTSSIGQLAWNAPTIRSSPRDRGLLLDFYNTRDVSRLFTTGIGDLVELYPKMRKTLFRKASYENSQRLFNIFVIRLLNLDETDFSMHFEHISRVHTIAGVQLINFYQFAFVAYFILRALGYPELQWTAFYLDMVRCQLQYRKTVRLLSEYTPEDVRCIIKIQSVVRRHAAMAEATARRARFDTDLYELLQGSKDVSSMKSSARSWRTGPLYTGTHTVTHTNTVNPKDWETDKVKLSLNDTAVVRVSWRALRDYQNQIVKEAATYALLGDDVDPNRIDDRASSDSQQYVAASKVASVAANLSFVIDHMEERKLIISKFVSLSGVLENCVSEANHFRFMHRLVLAVLRRSSCGNHPNMLVTWVAFVGFVLQLFTESNDFDADSSAASEDDEVTDYCI